MAKSINATEVKIGQGTTNQEVDAKRAANRVAKHNEKYHHLKHSCLSGAAEIICTTWLTKYYKRQNRQEIG